MIKGEDARKPGVVTFVKRRTQGKFMKRERTPQAGKKKLKTYQLTSSSTTEELGSGK